MEIYAILAQSSSGDNIELLYISTSKTAIVSEYTHYKNYEYEYGIEEYHLVQTKLNQEYKEGILNEPKLLDELGDLTTFEPDSKVYVVQLFSLYKGSYMSEPVFLTLDKEAAFNHAKNIKNTFLPIGVVPAMTLVYAMPLNCYYTLGGGLQNQEAVFRFKTENN